MYCAVLRHGRYLPRPGHADLVGMLAVCTGALIAILVLGERPALPAFAWAAALGIVWWAFAAAVLVVVRQATPGMLLAGMSFSGAVRPQRVVWVLVAALVGVGTFGLSGIIGGRGSALRLAAGTDRLPALLYLGDDLYHPKLYSGTLPEDRTQVREEGVITHGTLMFVLYCCVNV